MRECKGAGMWAAVEARLHTAQHAAQLLVSLGGGGGVACACENGTRQICCIFLRLLVLLFVQAETEG